MDAIKAWFETYEEQVKAILETIYNFVKGIFDKEVTPEFDKLV